MNRRSFVKSAAVLGTSLALQPYAQALPAGFPVVRPPLSARRFQSKAVEKAITTFKRKVKNQELAWLFENCFPNTLDTTVSFQTAEGRPDTYVITGDIDAMWLRDSTAQVWPYLKFLKNDKPLQQLVAGLINRQTACILHDPYANAFYNDPSKVGEWAKDKTDMKPGVHERKWEIDSLCYPIRLAYHYWQATGDSSPFDAEWKKAIQATLQVFRDQQRKTSLGPYRFQRETAVATDTVPMGGYGYPVKPVGLICSAFRPSDDATVYSFLVPANFFAVVSLKQAAAMVTQLSKDSSLAADLLSLATEVEQALARHAVVNHPQHGQVYAYEVDGFGSYYLMDDANVPSLLSLPYLGAVKATDPVYANTRKFLLSENNPYYFKGKAGAGIGGPHVGRDMIWPIALVMQGLTSTSDEEIKACIATLQRTHGNTGFMHESFHKDDAANFTRSWFAWANTIFGEFLWKTLDEKPYLLA
ncbi:MAG: glycoside hydrolase family 125 protein [Adhaeribacter sp.]